MHKDLVTAQDLLAKLTASPDPLLQSKSSEFQPKVEKCSDFLNSLRIWISKTELLEGAKVDKDILAKATEHQDQLNSWSDGVASCIKRCKNII